MNNNKREEKKRFAEAFEQPHFLISAQNIKIKHTKVEGFITYTKDLAALQFALAKQSSEEELQGFIDFFTEALNRHRKIERSENVRTTIKTHIFQLSLKTMFFLHIPFNYRCICCPSI